QVTGSGMPKDGGIMRPMTVGEKKVKDDQGVPCGQSNSTMPAMRPAWRAGPGWNPNSAGASSCGGVNPRITDRVYFEAGFRANRGNFRAGIAKITLIYSFSCLNVSAGCGGVTYDSFVRAETHCSKCLSLGHLLKKMAG